VPRDFWVMISVKRSKWIKKQVVLGICSSVGLTCFYLVSQRTNWLTPKPLICGGWNKKAFIQGPSIQALKALGAQPSFCVREVLRTYSSSMADVWAGVSVFRPDGETYIEAQFFVARNFGKDQFTDQPGDWMVQRTVRYNQWGVERWSRRHQVASWFDPMMNQATALELWKLVQEQIAPKYSNRQISWVRQLNERAPELAFAGFLIFFCYGVYKRFFGSPFDEEDVNRFENKRLAQRALLAELLLLVFLISGWLVLVWTDWIGHTPFLCSSFKSVKPGYSSPIKVCFHEALSLPGIDNQTTVLGTSMHMKDRVIRSDIQFYIANGNNRLGFKDEPGDWAFLGYKRFNPDTGLLQSSNERTISSWYDAVVPSDIQLQLWTQVRDEIAPRVQARRVTIPRKLNAVLQSFAALAAASVITIMTFIKLVEISVADENAP
jgi:hypothetical protein